VKRLAEGLRARPDVEAARALAENGQALFENVKQLAQLEGGEQDRQQLHRMLERCTDSLAELGGRLQDSMRRLSPSSTAALAAADLLAAVVWQLAGCCWLAASCCTLSRLASQPRQDWQRLAATVYALLHGGGLSLLEFSETSLRSLPPGRRGRPCRGAGRRQPALQCLPCGVVLRHCLLARRLAGGHRRVCKALGAARAAEKEQRRQLAAQGQ
jgi:hypothetical protein